MIRNHRAPRAPGHKNIGLFAKSTLIIFAFALLLTQLAACGEAKDSAAGLKDGVYSAKSKVVDEKGGYGHVELTVKDGKITACDYKTYQEDGTLKDESYGEGLAEALYELAQKCNESRDQYAAELVEKQKIGEVDAISGATSNHKMFVDAVKIALEGDASEQ